MKTQVLIVDDDPISLCVLTRYLIEADYAYVKAENGQQAWELLSDKPQEFAVVITDRIMPKLHGLELLAKMQAHPLLKQIPVIFLTGVAEKEEMIEVIKAGASDFLYKPIEKELLLAVLKRVMPMSNRVI